MQNDYGVLVDLLRRLKPSDMSVLRAALDTPDSQIATVRNSPNDVLWSAMVDLGFASEMTLDLDVGRELPHFHPKSFALTERGRTSLPDLLSQVIE